jgi:hypothetical protein
MSRKFLFCFTSLQLFLPGEFIIILVRLRGRVSPSWRTLMSFRVILIAPKPSAKVNQSSVPLMTPVLTPNESCNS